MLPLTDVHKAARRLTFGGLLCRAWMNIRALSIRLEIRHVRTRGNATEIEFPISHAAAAIGWCKFVKGFIFGNA